MTSTDPTSLYHTHLAPLVQQLQSAAEMHHTPYLATFFDSLGNEIIASASYWPATALSGPNIVDTDDVRGQAHVLRALEVSAAGGHNLLLTGSRGSGKSFLARCLPSLLPPLSRTPTPLPVRPPFRAPNASIGLSAFVGSQRRMTLGEVTLAHKGVLFLRDLPDYRLSVREVLKQMVEEKSVLVGGERWPASFQLIASMPPCPCGFYMDPIRECTCSAKQIMAYHNRMKWVRACFDMHIEVPRIQLDDRTRARPNESSAQISRRVLRARLRQEQRYREQPFSCNADLPSAQVLALTLSASAQKLFNAVISQLHLSPGSVCQTLRVAQTIADLADSDQIEANYIAEAVQYRVERVHAA